MIRRARILSRSFGRRAWLYGQISALALLGALAQSAAAETIRLGAGEHGAFSRVALNKTALAEWRARQMPRGIEIFLPGEAKSFDARAVNKTRKAHRVIEATTEQRGGETVLRLRFNCDCAGRVREIGGALVIDVRDGAPAPDDVRTGRRDVGSIETADIPSNASEHARDGDLSLETGDLGGATDKTAVELAREQFLRQLQRAAQEGIIEFRNAAPDAEIADDTMADETMADDTMADSATAGNGGKLAAPNQMIAPADVDAANSDARSAPHEEAIAPQPPVIQAIDEKSPAATPPTPMPVAAGDDTEPEPEIKAATPETAPAPMSACLADDMLDTKSWLDERSFSEGLAARRAALFDTLNRVDPDAVADLMRFYLGHQFAVEARHMARSFDVRTEETSLLVAMADVIDGVPPAYASPFARALPCPGAHGLWQAAAMSDIDPAGALTAFDLSGRALALAPSDLRRTLGGRIGLAALKIGRDQLAIDILRLLLRDRTPPTTDMLWLEAELDLKDGRALAAQERLTMIMEARLPRSPRAAILFAETLEAPQDHGRAVRHADVLSGFAFQYRDAEVGHELITAEARLRARFGDLSGAVGVIEAGTARLEEPPSDLIAMKREIVSTAIEALAHQAMNPSAEPKMVAAALAAARLDVSAESAAIQARLAEILTAANAAHLATSLDGVARRQAARAQQDAPVRQLASALEHARDAAKLIDAEALDANLAKIDAATAAPAALRAATLARYLEDAPAPSELTAVLTDRADAGNDPEAMALRGLIAPPAGPKGPESDHQKLERGKSMVDALDAEIHLLRRIARDG